ncbi:molybdenum ABC transporter ATP-binding protein [Flavobacterium kingsejongi]|uniref:Molybdenum ABC transporter ATP-binding protein n=1 Tax=Flavobacterium kingsejongi TaxID=1678728 RepID=A0A2S1LJE5_9FLAO|nr:molybdenum ABC transporter ATP-binding protein [Flavobacterium kingsejongi]AWG23894.1 molybdenum ABC transporter ATP-binding protein [Flavobacterium kingsejongi]
METKIIAIKFVRYDVPELETLQFAKVYLLRKKLNKGEKMNRAEKNWLADSVNRNAYFKRAVPLMGYRFGFEDVLKTYVVKQYGNWSEYNAPDKTSLKSIVYGRIDQIAEISN